MDRVDTVYVPDLLNALERFVWATKRQSRIEEALVPEHLRRQVITEDLVYGSVVDDAIQGSRLLVDECSAAQEELVEQINWHNEIRGIRRSLKKTRIRLEKERTKLRRFPFGSLDFIQQRACIKCLERKLTRLQERLSYTLAEHKPYLSDNELLYAVRARQEELLSECHCDTLVKKARAVTKQYQKRLNTLTHEAEPQVLMEYVAALKEMV